MKPAGFTYHRPVTVDDAVAVLAEVGPAGKVLAGGQSLVPLLNMRLAAPEHLVDINRLSGLAYVRADGDGVTVGALARHADVERDETAYAVLPLLRETLRHVAHPTIRNRGTTVGSIAHADPAGELTAVLALLGGTVTLRRAGGQRTVAAADFFTGPMSTCADAGELVTSVTFPVPEGRTGAVWTEVARRHGDYAVCGTGVVVTLDDDLRVAGARAAYVSMGPEPVVVDLTEAVAGAMYDDAGWPAAGRLAAGLLEPDDDIHATAAYRRHLAEVLTARALREAAGRAAGGQR
ncbi:FAD binding domain-containing protein [Jiangella rhizosphaerae]|uniref:Xanthine dehydrogenase family protein subunit M n=1 Tax=Jiangella rhizosphaerae TaxID=2293569 RepID=A0A418KHV7_9ACTN|nr:xanthine dehydrogenase family protein subunit M [Jiangella rhizosphaerae]RIQ12029.1 xanthine dehydrogenase family protein subunit M [Jiangella rhizosphaerae]